MDIDRPLDEIVEEKRAERRKASSARGGRGGRGASRGGSSARAAGRAAVAGKESGSVGPVRNRHSGGIAASNSAGPAAASGRTAAAAVPLMVDGSKIMMSNLPQDVTENQIRDLITQTVGPASKVALSYDKNGKSSGQATVELRRPGDAQIAFNTYNGRLIDGAKAIKVEILFDPTRLPPPPLTDRIGLPKGVQLGRNAPAAVAASGGAGRGRGGHKGKSAADSGNTLSQTAVDDTSSAGGRGRRGPARGRGRGGRGGSDRPAVTAEDLDAEMEDYQKNASAVAA